MSIAVKNSGVKLNNTIKRGNLALGINNIEYGSTSETGYYTAMSVPTNGYVLYETDSSGKLRMYKAQNDTEFINIINSFGAKISTISEALLWVGNNSNFLIKNANIPNIATDSLDLFLDGSNLTSYPKSGTNAYNVVGNALPLVNNVSYNNAGYFVFDGTNDYIQGDQTSTLFTDSSFAIEAWVYPTTPAPNSQVYFSAHNSMANYSSIHLRIYSTGTIRFGFYGNDLDTPGSTAIFDRWNHIVCTFDNTSKIASIYLNGVLVVTGSKLPFTASSANIRIGSWFNLEYFKGNIGVVRAYTKNLSAYEIYQNYITTLNPNIITDGKSLIQNWGSLASLTARTANALIAPDGTRSATLFERISINPNGHAQIRQALPVVDLLPSTSYDVCFWAKRVSLTQRLDFEFSDTPQQIITLTNDWKFYSFRLTTTATFPNGEFIDIGSTTTSAGSVLNEQYSIWNLHVSLTKT